MMPEIPLDILRQEKLTQIVSLGMRCAVAYNLRRYFNFATAMPFDWWLTPPEGLRQLLSDFDVDYLYDPDLLELTENAASVLHKELEILLHHEFPRDFDRPDEPVLPNFAEHIEAPRARTVRLRDRLMSANRDGERILFVREADYDDALIQTLHASFDRALWSCVWIEKIPDGDFEWTSDPELWDAALSRLGVALDRTNHAEFAPNLLLA